MMMLRLFLIALFGLCALCTVGARAQSVAPSDQPVYTVVITRHGVRSPSIDSTPYVWPDWQPVPPKFLSAHGAVLMTSLGRYYANVLSADSRPVDCVSTSAFVYADLDQRTLATANALVDGLCRRGTTVTVYHAPLSAAYDALFDGADWLSQTNLIDARASRAAVLEAAGATLDAPVHSHAADFRSFGQFMRGRCRQTCPQLTDSASSISMKNGLAELTGPVTEASGDAEDVFLEYAQCRPPLAMSEGNATRLAADVETGMRLHVLAYDINSRSPYNAQVRGSNMLAHIVALLQAAAGLPHPGVDVPPVAGQRLAIIVGHDTQLGALGGVLAAHWEPGAGIARDDMPPGSALVFRLLRGKAGSYRVQVRFVTDTLAQFRSNDALPGGIAEVPVSMNGCSGTDCSVALEDLGALVSTLQSKGFVRHGWTLDVTVPKLAPLVDPAWTNCRA